MFQQLLPLEDSDSPLLSTERCLVPQRHPHLMDIPNIPNTPARASSSPPQTKPGTLLSCPSICPQWTVTPDCCYRAALHFRALLSFARSWQINPPGNYNQPALALFLDVWPFSLAHLLTRLQVPSPSSHHHLHSQHFTHKSLIL